MRNKTIVITTGDFDGIGLEVTQKALVQFQNEKNRFLVFRSQLTKYSKRLNLPKQKVLFVTNLEEAINELQTKKSPYQIIEYGSDESPASWVEIATKLCLNSLTDGMVTGPVSKKTFIDAQLSHLGHTTLIKSLCGAEHAYMGFLGKSFNVVSLTGHIPLNKVESYLTHESLESGISTILCWFKNNPSALAKGPVGILGLNPHSGEGGLIGSFEVKYLLPALVKFKMLKGPLVPDAAFSKENQKKYSLFIGLYHDQVLIPFKMIHGHLGGAHVTIGLPIVRTSVDHGTAKEIFGKGIARPESMIDAIRWCLKLIAKKKG